VNVPRAHEFNRPIADQTLVACHNCDLLQHLPPIESGGSARCPRCNEEMRRRREDSLHRTLALAIAAAILYVIANTVPMLSLTIVGRAASTTVLGGAQVLWRDQRETVSALVLFTAILAPAFQIGFMLAIVIGALRKRPRHWVAHLLRHHKMTRIWSMVEVMMLGVLVALTKIADYATVVPGIALFVLGALIFVLAAMQSGFDPHEVWERIEWADENAPGDAAPLLFPEAES
jgi:paraquat-inducible protein A